MILGKLFNLKKWLTVSEAARRLSTVCGREVTEAEVLCLALDGHLKLSVNFVNHTLAECGEVVDGEGKGNEDPEWMGFPYEMVEVLETIPEWVPDEHIASMMSLDINDKRFLNLSGQLAVIKGAWDLPMIGGERLDVEQAYQRLIGGPPVTRIRLIGALVESRTGRTMCQLQEKSNILKTCCTRFRLPEDSAFVVRTDALREFEQSINGFPTNATTATLENLNKVDPRVAWRIILFQNIAKIDNENDGKAKVGQVIKWLKINGGERIKNEGEAHELVWIDDNGSRQTVIKKTISSAISTARNPA